MSGPSASRTLLAAMASVVLACGGGPARTVSLHMGGGPASASVTIDDMWIGTLGMVTQHGVALPPGRHRITVEAPGHFPWDRLVEVKEGDPAVKLDVAMIPVPD